MPATEARQSAAIAGGNPPVEQSVQRGANGLSGCERAATGRAEDIIASATSTVVPAKFFDERRAAMTATHFDSQAFTALGDTLRAVAPVIPDPRRIRTFADEAAFETWLAAHHDREPEVWIKVHKKASGLASVTTAQALDVALCWGWIDAIRKGFDERSFLQRYTPRGRRSIWSQINRAHVARLVTAGRMTPHGLRQVDAAKADGRWAAAYAPVRETSAFSLPTDLRAAVAASPRATRTLRTLSRQNLFSLAFRTNAMKTAAGRAKKIRDLVAMLARGKTIHPQAAARPARPASAARRRSRP